jgi:HK97 family phage major capsid protein
MSTNAARHAVWTQARKIIDDVVADGRDRPTLDEHRRIELLMADLDVLDGAVSTFDRSSLYRKGPDTVSTTTLANILASRDEQHLVRYASREQRALAVGTASAGGNLAPQDFVNELWRHLETRSPVIANARIFSTQGGRDLVIPTLTSWGSAVSAAEGSAIGGVDPTFGQTILRDHKYGQIVRVSNELLADQAVGLEGFMAELFARNVDQLVGPLYAFGTGTTQPQGYAYAAGSTITGGTGVAGRFTYNNLADAFSALDSGYQAGAIWMMSPSAVGTLRKLTDDNGQPLWQAPVSTDAPPTLFGRPIAVDRHLGAVATGGTSVVVIDPSAFAVRLADGGVIVDRSPDAYFEYDQTGFRATLRTDSALLDSDAAVRFVGGTA